MITILTQKQLDKLKESEQKIGRDQAAIWAIATVARLGNKPLARSMMGLWGIKDLVDLKHGDPYDNEAVIPLLKDRRDA